MTQNAFYQHKLNELLRSNDIQSCSRTELLKIAFREGWNSAENYHGYEIQKMSWTEKMMNLDIEPPRLKSHLFDPKT